MNNQNINKRSVQTNGFQWQNGPNYYQLISWLYFILDFILVFFFYIIELTQATKVSYIISSNQSLYFSFGQYSIFFWQLDLASEQHILTQPIPQCMPRGRLQIKGLFRIIYIFTRKIFKTKLKQFCTVCQAHVNDKTKHCSRCNRFHIQINPSRCCSYFDHHCVWLNNCIGDRNYFYFFSLVVFLVTFKMTKYGLNILIIVQKQQLHVFLISTICQGFIFAYISIFFDLFVLVPLCYLLGVHCYFRKKGITTYEFIKMKRERAQEKLKKKERLQIDDKNQENITLQEDSKKKEQNSLIHYSKGVTMIQKSQMVLLNTNLINMSTTQGACHKTKTSIHNIQKQPPSPKEKIISENKLEMKRSVPWERDSAEIVENQSFHAQLPMEQPALNFDRMRNDKKNDSSNNLYQEQTQPTQFKKVLENINQFKKDYEDSIANVEASIISINIAVEEKQMEMVSGYDSNIFSPPPNSGMSKKLHKSLQMVQKENPGDSLNQKEIDHHHCPNFTFY